MYQNLFVHTPLDGPWVCFQFLPLWIKLLQTLCASWELLYHRSSLLCLPALDNVYSVSLLKDLYYNAIVISPCGFTLHFPDDQWFVHRLDTQEGIFIEIDQWIFFWWKSLHGFIYTKATFCTCCVVFIADTHLFVDIFVQIAYSCLLKTWIVLFLLIRLFMCDRYSHLVR